ncbi:Uncharacterised protein [Lacrimispora sphenoides]|uniref:Uncharacterized protein n=1 Tax=Lacrimispora sphenoides JCM 1415 TaxID=1297793 RepID=A0ABY1CHI5_9FIRM|nr:hypothetical protein SAMN02745906_4246 [[Clostridium] sphenoides JCM 1415]SUY48824.1 Uncharacterised protein [Lacrimispora sphenoides]
MGGHILLDEIDLVQNKNMVIFFCPSYYDNTNIIIQKSLPAITCLMSHES